MKVGKVINALFGRAWQKDSKEKRKSENKQKKNGKWKNRKHKSKINKKTRGTKLTSGVSPQNTCNTPLPSLISRIPALGEAVHSLR